MNEKEYWDSLIAYLQRAQQGSDPDVQPSRVCPICGNNGASSKTCEAKLRAQLNS